MVSNKKAIQGIQGASDIHRVRKNPRLKKQSPIYRGLKPGWRRHTVIVREKYFEKVMDIAYWDRKDIKEVIDEALESYLKGKDIKVRPRKKED